VPTRTISPRPTRLLTPGWVPSLIPSSPLFAKQAAFKTTHVPAFRAALERGGPFLSSSHAHDSWAWVDDAFPSAVATFANAADDVSRRADALETALRGEGKKETETETDTETKHTRRGIMHKTNGFGRRDGSRLRRRARALVAAVAATRGPPSVVSVAEAYFARRLAEFAAKAECSLEEDEEGTDDVPDEANDDEETEDRETYATSRDLQNDGGGGDVSMDVDGDSSENVFGSGLDRQQSLMLSTGASGLARTHSLMPASAVARATASVADVMGARWAAALASVGSHMRVSGAFGSTCAAAAAAAIAFATRARVAERASGSFEKRFLSPLLRWVDAVPLAFLKQIGLVTSIETDDASAAWRARVAHCAYESLGARLVAECFDVVVEFPDSKPALFDLRRCLRRTSLRFDLTHALRDTLRRRLLIAGAPTSDIIDTYRLLIRAMNELDPSGVVLAAVSGPLKEYLRERKDTIRCVVSMLMGAEADDEDGEANMGGLLSRDEPNAANADSSAGLEGGLADDGDAEFLEFFDNTLEAGRVANSSSSHRERARVPEWAKWEPEPVESEAAASRGRRRGGDDELGQLVSIYGSKELFIAEYRNMLAERLLSKVGHDVDRETHALELLKLRFGEASLHKCEVMLKDMRDSKRLNGNIKAPPAVGTPAANDDKARTQTETLRSSPLDATVVSALFWPPFADEAPDFKLPDAMNDLLETYGERYHHLKAPRKMKWRPTIGVVQMEIMWRDVEVSVSVGPIEAALIHFFQDKERWSANDLATALGVSKQTLRRKAVVWINAGVLKEEAGGDDVSKHGYRLTTGADADAAEFEFGAAAADDSSAGGGGAVASAEDQAAAGMKVYEQYVIGMLTNFPSLPLDRIHNMLKMFVSEPPYDRTSEQLAAFLAQLVAEDKVVMEGNQYKRRTS
jgi:anaphase-promoting complex subunit 2